MQNCRLFTSQTFKPMKTKRYRVVLKPRTGNIYFINIDEKKNEDYLMYAGDPKDVDVTRIYNSNELIVSGSYVTLKNTEAFSMSTFSKWAGLEL